MPLSLFEGALGGIGLFLLGMRIMSDGIRTVADDRIRSVFSAVTSNRFYSITFGSVLALTLNSPIAAVIFSIGLVNGGVLNIFQALNVMAGVLIGASLSLYLPVVPYGLVATPLIFVGVLLKFFARRRRLANAGNLLLGAGLLFFGLSLLEGSFSPSDNHPFYGAFNGAFFKKPVPALFFGSLLSCFVQSTVSLISVVSSLVTSHNMGKETAGVMTLGGFVGVASLACLASITGISVSRRIAMFFLLFNLAVILPLILVAPSLITLLNSNAIPLLSGLLIHNTSLQNYLTHMHTVASLLTAFLVTTLSGVVSRFSGYRDDHDLNSAAIQPCAGYLDVRILNTPTLAIEQARKEIIRMIAVTSFMFADTREILFDFDARRAETIRQHEQVLDSLNHEITAFLSKLARSTHNPEICFEIPGLFQVVTDLEHIGDSCEEILDCILKRKEANIFFSEDAMADLKRLAMVVGSGFNTLEKVLVHGPQDPESSIHDLKSNTRSVFDEIKKIHFERICSGVCPPRTAMMFNELNAAFMRIAELCWNIMAAQERTTV
ncbi:MAG: Na/Pi cotransporter family protein [Desulfuromonadales bacterium]|nr:Na/Pi cotransporter family protein [Desulfuromonadales bacterium]